MPLDEDVIRLAKGKNLATVVTLMPDGQPQALLTWVDSDGEYAGMHDGDVSAAYAAGLTCRPVEQTVTDTWRWLQDEGYPPPGRIAHGLSPDKEQAVLASLPR